jgi:hypothetical protein
VVIEKRSQWIILILSAAIPGQSGLYTFFNRLIHKGENLICLPPVIAMVNMARGPPFFFVSQCVQMLNAHSGNALIYTG